MKKKQNNLELGKRQKLKKELRWGDISKIASIAGVSKMAVSRWFKCEYDDAFIEKAVKELLNKRRQGFTKRLSSIL